MADPRVEKLARLLVDYSLAVRPGEKVLIRGNSSSLPLVAATYRSVLAAGGHPFLLWEEEVFAEYLLREGSDEQIQFLHEPHLLLYESYDCLMSLAASENTRTLSGVDPARQRLLLQARSPLTETYLRRSAAGTLRWIVSRFPTPAYAQDADMSLRDYEDFVYQACRVDRDDPVAEWRAFEERQARLVATLAGRDRVEVRGPNAELTFSIAGRTFLNSCGHRNMPDGEIFTGPVESSMNGWIRFTYPAIYQGREVEGIELRFVDGQVVEATAAKNGAYLEEILATDAGARFVGEFAIGTNESIQHFTRSILFDEKIGGTIHLALGASYPETGGQNRSAVHWDMICDMQDGGQIFVDGERFYDSGRFLVDGPSGDPPSRHGN